MDPKRTREQRDPLPLDDEMLVTIGDLGDVVRRIRRDEGLTQEEAAQMLGLKVEVIARAEEHRAARLLRLRKRILQGLGGYTIDGPFYQVRALDDE